jgi:hypothetical protein
VSSKELVCRSWKVEKAETLLGTALVFECFVERGRCLSVLRGKRGGRNRGKRRIYRRTIGREMNRFAGHNSLEEKKHAVSAE